MTVYFGALVYLNGLSADYALGYLFVFAGLALAHSLAYTERGPFVRYLLVSTSIALLIVALVDGPGVYPPLFVLSVGALAVMMYISVVARMETYRQLRISQVQHTAAEALAGAGSCDHERRAQAHDVVRRRTLTCTACRAAPSHRR